MEQLHFLAKQSDGVYAVDPIPVWTGDDIITQADLTGVTEERARVRLGDKTVMKNVLVRTIAGMREVYLRDSDWHQ